MQPMKRVGRVSLGIVAAAWMLAAFGFGGAATAAVTCPGGQVPADNGVCIGQPGAGAPVAAPASDSDPIAKNNDYVCTAIKIFSDQHTGRCAAGEAEIPNDQNGGAIVYYLKLILRLLSELVGGVILLMLVVAGIQYITSVGDPTRVKAAKSRIQNAIIALVLFLMMFAIINFLIPGGVLTL